MKTKLTKRVTALGVAALLALPLAACGDDAEVEDATAAADDAAAEPAEEETTAEDDAAEPTEEESSEDEAAGDETPEDEATDDEATGDETSDEEGSEGEGAEGDASGGAPEPIKIDHEFEDKETGDKITVLNAMRNVPSEQWRVKSDGAEMVYIEVKIVPGDKFMGTVSYRDFGITDSEGTENRPVVEEEEMEALGLEVLESVRRREGEATGWIAIPIETPGGTVTGTYTRPEAKVLGENETVPEFVEEFEIPES